MQIIPIERGRSGIAPRHRRFVVRRNRRQSIAGPARVPMTTVCSNCGAEINKGFADRGACLNFCRGGCVREFYGDPPSDLIYGAFAL